MVGRHIREAYQGVHHGRLGRHTYQGVPQGVYYGCTYQGVPQGVYHCGGIIGFSTPVSLLGSPSSHPLHCWARDHPLFTRFTVGHTLGPGPSGPHIPDILEN